MTVANRFEADVLAARLHDEGLEVRLQVGIGSAYGITMGSLAAVDVFVPETHLADARLILLAGDVDEVLDDTMRTPDDRTRQVRTVWRVAAAVLLTGAALPVLHLLS